MDKTKHLGLSLNGSTEQDMKTTFSTWRKTINGETDDSNMNIIDRAVGDLRTAFDGFKNHTHSYNDLTDVPTPPQVPAKLPNPEALTINGHTYDGSEKIEININETAVDDTLTQAGQAADAKAAGEAFSQLKEDLYTHVEKTLSANDDFDWQSGWFETDGIVHEHQYFKHSKIMATVPNTEITFTNLRAPANYIACIACFSGTKYVHDASLKGEAYTAFLSGTFTVPENVDGVSFVSYVDANSSKSIAVTLTLIETKSDENESNIKNLMSDNQEIKKQIKNVTDDVAEI